MHREILDGRRPPGTPSQWDSRPASPTEWWSFTSHAFCLHSPHHIALSKANGKARGMQVGAVSCFFYALLTSQAFHMASCPALSWRTSPTRLAGEHDVISLIRLKVRRRASHGADRCAEAAIRSAARYLGRADTPPLGRAPPLLGSIRADGISCVLLRPSPCLLALGCQEQFYA